MEVCPDKAVDQLLRARVDPSPSLQHSPHCQVILQSHQETQGEGKESLRQIQRYNYFNRLQLQFGQCRYHIRKGGCGGLRPCHLQLRTTLFILIFQEF